MDRTLTSCTSLPIRQQHSSGPLPPITSPTEPCQKRQLLPSINGFNNVVTNSDGSVDLWFAPAKPADVPQSNWIHTVNGRNFIAALRLYGTGTQFFDQTWKPDDVVKVR